MPLFMVGASHTPARLLALEQFPGLIEQVVLFAHTH